MSRPLHHSDYGQGPVTRADRDGLKHRVNPTLLKIACRILGSRLVIPLPLLYLLSGVTDVEQVEAEEPRADWLLRTRCRGAARST